MKGPEQRGGEPGWDYIVGLGQRASSLSMLPCIDLSGKQIQMTVQAHAKWSYFSMRLYGAEIYETIGTPEAKEIIKRLEELVNRALVDQYGVKGK